MRQLRGKLKFSSDCAAKNTQKKILLIINVFITKMFICFWFRQKLRYLGHLLKKAPMQMFFGGTIHVSTFGFGFGSSLFLRRLFCYWNLYIRITQIKSIMQSI